MTWEFSNFVFKTVEIRFVCNNHAFQSSLLFHLAMFLSTGELFLKSSSLCFLNSDLHLACVWNCLCWHHAAVNSRVESILQLNCPECIPTSLFGQHLLLCIALLSSTFSCLKAFWRSNSSCTVWIVSSRYISLNMKDSKFPSSSLLTSMPGRSWLQWLPSCI